MDVVGLLGGWMDDGGIIYNIVVNMGGQNISSPILV